MLRYQAVLFDLDGTLLDSSRDVIAAVQFALDEADPGRSIPDNETILSLIGNPLEVILAELGYPHDPASARTFTDTYRQHYAEHFREHTALYPGAEQVLSRLRSVGATTAIVTTKLQSQADLAVRAFGLDRFFDCVHGWQEGRRHKPDPEPVMTALERLGAAPGQAIMVGDSELDIQAAQAAGVATCAVAYGYRPAWLLSFYHPDFLIPALTDLVAIVAGPES
jgi:pyrophosphatase PpaX